MDAKDFSTILHLTLLFLINLLVVNYRSIKVWLRLNLYLKNTCYYPVVNIMLLSRRINQPPDHLQTNNLGQKYRGSRAWTAICDMGKIGFFLELSKWGFGMT